MNGTAAKFSLFPNPFGKSPEAFFYNLEPFENNGVFLCGKMPEVGNFFHRRFVFDLTMG